MTGPVFMVSAWLGVAVLDGLLWYLGYLIVRAGYRWVVG